MVEEKENIEIVFIVSHLRDNTTSAERYKSFIRSFLSQNYSVKILEFDYPWKESTWMGHEIDNKDILDNDILDNVIIVKPILNPFQKFIFNLFAREKTLIAKIFHILYQLIYKKDINHPGDNCFPSELNKEKGFIIVSGGPFGIFSYAEKLAGKLNYKLVLDYRDPWTFGYQFVDTNSYIYKLKVRLNRGKEYKLLSKAGLITTVSPTLKSYYPQEFQDKIQVVINGSNFKYEDNSITSPGTFNIVYAGTVYYNQLTDDIFFKAIKVFIQNKNVATIRLQFLGSYYNQEIKVKLSNFGLDEIAEVTKRLKREELISYLNEASVFLHLKYGNKSGVITSKQADYLALQKPILLPVSDNGDIAESIIKNNAGYVCNTVEENVAVLEMLYEKFQKGESLTISQSEDMLRNNSRKYIAKEFVDLVLKSGL